MTRFLVIYLNAAEKGDCMMSGRALIEAVIFEDLTRPGLLHMVAKILGVRPLIVSYSKKNGKKDDGDSLVVV